KTLAGLFRERVRRTPHAVAYRYFDDTAQVWRALTWQEIATQVAKCQAAMEKMRLQAGDRVAVMLRNSWQWVMVDQAALGLGLVMIPLYINDRADNIAAILQETQASLLFIEGDEHWRSLRHVAQLLTTLQRIITIQAVTEKDLDARIQSLETWLA